MKARCFAGLAALVSFIVSAPVAAEVVAASVPAGRVQILQPSATSPRAKRCLTRIREELTAGGFEVATSEFAADGDALWTLDQPSPHDSLATLVLVGDPDAGAAELWIVDGVPGGRAAVRRLLLPAGSGQHDEEVLAVRTLEFLRASALELEKATAAPPSPPPAPVPVVAEAPRAAPPPQPVAASRVAFELGLCLLESSRALGPSYLPLVRLRLDLPSVLEARLGLATFGSRPRVTSANGSAAVAQDFGLAELRAVFRRGQRVRPTVGMGAGAVFVRVEGAGNGPYGGLRGEQWAALFDAGMGLTVMLGRRLAIAAEVHGQVAAPYPTIYLAGEEAARLGRPSFATTFTLVIPL